MFNFLNTPTSGENSQSKIPQDLIPPRVDLHQSDRELSIALYDLLQTRPDKRLTVQIPNKKGMFYRVRPFETPEGTPYLSISIMQEPLIRHYDFYDGLEIEPMAEQGKKASLDGVPDTIYIWDLHAKPLPKPSKLELTEELKRDYSSILEYVSRETRLNNF